MEQRLYAWRGITKTTGRWHKPNVKLPVTVWPCPDSFSLSIYYASLWARPRQQADKHIYQHVAHNIIFFNVCICVTELSSEKRKPFSHLSLQLCLTTVRCSLVTKDILFPASFCLVFFSSISTEDRKKGCVYTCLWILLQMWCMIRLFNIELKLLNRPLANLNHWSIYATNRRLVWGSTSLKI